MSDPLFRSIQDPRPMATVNGSTFATRERSGRKGNSFATTVLPVETTVQGNLTTDGLRRDASSFCNISGHTLGQCRLVKQKGHKEKMDFDALDV